MAKKNIFNYEWNQYTRDTNLSEKQIREEYSRLRDIAQKRVKRLAESEWTYTEAYKQHQKGFRKVADIPEAQMKNALTDIYRFLHTSTSSISGLKQQRREAVKTLQSNGYKFVNAKNYKEFYEFMNDIKNRFELLYMEGSDIVADLFNDFKALDIPIKQLQEDFEFWMEHREALDTVDALVEAGEIKRPKRRTAEWYKQQIERLS